jgi:hypothetical protein
MGPMVLDIETFYDFHSCVGYDGENWYEFYFTNDDMSQFDDYIDWLESLNEIITYNGENFDRPILDWIVHNQDAFRVHQLNATSIYDLATTIIESDEPVWEIVPIRRYFKNIDLLKIHHYDNKARMTSLKWLEFAMRMEDIRDISVDIHSPIPKEKYAEIIAYNRHDVYATWLFYMKSQEEIEFRRHLIDKYKKRAIMNYSDVKIGEYINRVTYMEKTGLNWEDFKDRRTYRDVIRFRDIIPDWIQFFTPEMNRFVENLKKTGFRAGGKFEREIKFNEDLTVTFALGGIHSQDERRIVGEKDGKHPVEWDVGGMYPYRMIQDKLFPEHLSVEWVEGLSESYNHRQFELKPLLKTLEKGSAEWKYYDKEQRTIKLSLNGGGYGKTGSSYSWQYDPLVMYKVTIPGQLSLLMFIEACLIRGIEVVSANTDGVVVMQGPEDEETMKKIVEYWEEQCSFIMERTDYEKIIFNSVNSYVAVIKAGDSTYLKTKNEFAYDVEYHKNSSQRIVPIAICNYFINGVHPSDTIRNHLQGKDYEIGGSTVKNYGVYDFCIARKISRNQKLILVKPDEPEYITSRVFRYYISKTGWWLKRIFLSGKMVGRKPQNVNKGWRVKSFMRYHEDVDVDYSYYEEEANKIIRKIEGNTRVLEGKGKQISLF